ncbi:hypothetical protein IJ090_01070 [Candidatus Saccharibacteria bacterium]|nr:hypothetical protein [Candidatus Saccharibacteria bacterium]
MDNEKPSPTSAKQNFEIQFGTKTITLNKKVIPAVFAVAVILLIGCLCIPSTSRTGHNTNSAYNSDKVVDKSDEELVIEDLLGVSSSLEETSNLASEKATLRGIYDKLGTAEENCKGEVVEKSKKTFFDSKNNFTVVEHEISVTAGILDKELDKYTIGKDGILYRTSDNKKYKAMGGLGITQAFSSSSKHYNKYIDYGILGVTCTVSIVANYSDEEKGYTKELDPEDENFGTYFLGTDIMWGVYADGSLTTDSDTYIVMVGRNPELNDAENDVSENALSDSHTDTNLYPNLKENISPISEIHIFNFDFSINEETKEFVNKWSYAVSKNER